MLASRITSGSRTRRVPTRAAGCIESVCSWVIRFGRVGSAADQPAWAGAAARP
jgi:hypothetical protein